MWYGARSGLGVQLAETRLQLAQSVIGPGTQGTQRMVCRDSLFRAEVVEHTQLLLLFSTHAIFLSVWPVETIGIGGNLVGNLVLTKHHRIV
jgi:hypothetical protein